MELKLTLLTFLLKNPTRFESVLAGLAGEAAALAAIVNRLETIQQRTLDDDHPITRYHTALSAVRAQLQHEESDFWDRLRACTTRKANIKRSWVALTTARTMVEKHISHEFAFLQCNLCNHPEPILELLNHSPRDVTLIVHNTNSGTTTFTNNSQDAAEISQPNSTGSPEGSSLGTLSEQPSDFIEETLPAPDRQFPNPSHVTVHPVLTEGTTKSQVLAAASRLAHASAQRSQDPVQELEPLSLARVSENYAPSSPEVSENGLVRSLLHAVQTNTSGSSATSTVVNGSISTALSSFSLLVSIFTAYYTRKAQAAQHSDAPAQDSAPTSESSTATTQVDAHAVMNHAAAPHSTTATAQAIIGVSLPELPVKAPIKMPEIAGSIATEPSASSTSIPQPAALNHSPSTQPALFTSPDHKGKGREVVLDPLNPTVTAVQKLINDALQTHPQMLNYGFDIAIVPRAIQSKCTTISNMWARFGAPRNGESSADQVSGYELGPMSQDNETDEIEASGSSSNQPANSDLKMPVLDCDAVAPPPDTQEGSTSADLTAQSTQPSTIMTGASLQNPNTPPTSVSTPVAPQPPSSPEVIEIGQDQDLCETTHGYPEAKSLLRVPEHVHGEDLNAED